MLGPMQQLFLSLPELLRAQAPRRQRSLMLGVRSVSIFLDRMQNKPHEPWNLDLMAERSGLARTRFSHFDSNLTNLCPMEYMQQQRVEKAKLLLAGTGKSITEIALECGFATSACFSSVIRRHVHCSPSEYRDAGPISR